MEASQRRRAGEAVTKPTTKGFPRRTPATAKGFRRFFFFWDDGEGIPLDSLGRLISA
jgi:hypothetical protein